MNILGLAELSLALIGNASAQADEFVGRQNRDGPGHFR
jgi:hypothetical protein